MRHRDDDNQRPASPQESIGLAVGILADALYTTREVAWMLGYRGKDKSNTNRVAQISPIELVRTRTGPRGGKVMFLGRDILAYIESRRQTVRAS